MQLGQLAQTETLGTVPKQGLAIDVEPWPANVLAFELSPSHAGTDTLDNIATMSLRSAPTAMRMPISLVRRSML